jgi:hypothetical protein
MRWLKNRIGEASTSGGLAVFGSAAMGFLTGSMSWQQAATVAVGGLIAVLFPEKKAA